MILSGERIKQLQGRRLHITPFNEKQINPNSYNLTLADELLVYDRCAFLDMKKDNPVEKIKIPENGLILDPNRIYLGRTAEHTYTPYHVPMLEGRSSCGRLGLAIHATAGFGDVGFNGYWTLELFCIQPVRIYAGVEICQIYYHSIDGDYIRYDGGKYQNNEGVQPSMMWKDFRSNAECESE